MTTTTKTLKPEESSDLWKDHNNHKLKTSLQDQFVKVEHIAKIYYSWNLLTHKLMKLV
jgi:hypothetical protein